MRQCPKCRKEYPKGVEFCPRDGAKTISYTQSAGAQAGGSSKRIRLQMGNYTLIRKLGEGGMGVVFEAEHKLIQKRVALKMLHADKANDKQISSRFVREAKISSQIKNPHVVDITDFGETESGDLYLVMEFLEGKDVGHYLEARGHLQLVEAQHILIQVANALAAAHKVGVIHRDLKPDNIFLINKEGDPRYVKLLDFGIAKLAEGGGGLTKAGMIIGTPEYMSPEQCEGKPVDQRSDIYSLGIIAYQMFTGKVPFAHEHFSRVLLMHNNDPPLPPRKLRPELRIPIAVEATILKCLEKRPEDRYQSMSEVIAAVTRWADENVTLLDGFSESDAHTVISSSPMLQAVQAPAPMPTLNLDGVLIEDVDEEEATQAAGVVLNLSGSMIADAPTVMPEDLESAETITPGMLQKPPSRPQLASPSPRPVPAPSSLAAKSQPPSPQVAPLSKSAAPQMGIATEALPRVVQPAPAPGRSRLAVIIGSALGATVLGAVLLYLLLGGPEPVKTPPPPSPPKEPTTRVAPQPEEPALKPEPIETITLSVKARPATGVEVRVAGEEKLLGTLPDPILLPKGEEEITLEFSKKGYLKVSKNITPDQDQRFRVRLTQGRSVSETSPDGLQDPFKE